MRLVLMIAAVLLPSLLALALLMPTATFYKSVTDCGQTIEKRVSTMDDFEQVLDRECKVLQAGWR